MLRADADTGDFGIGVDAGGDRVHVYRWFRTIHGGDGRASFCSCHVSELDAADDIADGIDARNRGLEVRINQNTAFFHFHRSDFLRGFLRKEPFGVSSAADGNQDQIRDDLHGFVLLRKTADHSVFAFSDFRYRRLSVDVDSLDAFHQHLQILADFLIHVGDDAVQSFYNRHFDAQRTEHRCELAADNASAHDKQAVQRPAPVQHLIAGYHAILICARNRGKRRDRTRGDHDIGALQLLRSAFRKFHADATPVENSSGAVVDCDFIRLHQHRDAAPELIQNSIFAFLYFFQIESVAVSAGQTELFTVRFNLVVQRGGVEKRLCGDAPAVQAGPSQLAVFNQRHLHFVCLCRIDGGLVASRSGADDDQIVFFHNYIFSLIRSVISFFMALAISAGAAFSGILTDSMAAAISASV